MFNIWVDGSWAGIVGWAKRQKDKEHASSRVMSVHSIFLQVP
jgi:hypothetical protein